MRLLRVGQPLPASQTLGPPRGVVYLRAGEPPPDNQSPNRAPTSSVSCSKNAHPSPRRLRPREIRHLRRASLAGFLVHVVTEFQVGTDRDFAVHWGRSASDDS